MVKPPNLQVSYYADFYPKNKKIYFCIFLCLQCRNLTKRINQKYLLVTKLQKRAYLPAATFC